MILFFKKKKKLKWSPLSRSAAIRHGPWGHEYKQAVWFGGALKLVLAWTWRGCGCVDRRAVIT